MKRNHYIGLAFVALVLVLGLATVMVERRAAVQAAGVEAPMFEVDPMWPKPMPNHWLIGMTIGVSVDAQDHIWIVHRQGSLEKGELHAESKPPMAVCCAAAPPILEFAQDGTLLRHWGGPGQGMTGRIPTMASRSITKATCGSAAMDGASRPRRLQVGGRTNRPRQPTPLTTTTWF